jgi:hypothetical protein
MGAFRVATPTGVFKWRSESTLINIFPCHLRKCEGDHFTGRVICLLYKKKIIISISELATGRKRVFGPALLLYIYNTIKLNTKHTK